MAGGPDPALLDSSGDAAPLFSQIRYLLAKKTVDDRALNRHVWNSLRTALAESRTQRLRVIEIGAGIGTMIERALDWGLFEDLGGRTTSGGARSAVAVDLTAIDPATACLAEARRRLLPRALAGHAPTSMTDTHLQVHTAGVSMRIQFDPVDYAEFAARGVNRGAWHLVMANAVLDLVDLRHALPVILSLLEPGGLFYFTINFDGGTLFLPVIDEGFDSLIYDLYHATMNRGSGASMVSGSRAGRLLFASLRTLGADMIDMGSSDWVVFPSGGRYPDDEAYFLHCLVSTIANALVGHTRLDSERFANWIALRHEQIMRAELALVSHQLDFVGRVSGPRVSRL